MGIKKIKSRFRPLYKKLYQVKENVVNQKKVLKFKKKKWQIFIQTYKKKFKRYRKFKPYDQMQYIATKYPNKKIAYNKRYRSTLIQAKKFKIFYGNLQKRVLKNTLKSAKNSKGSRKYSAFKAFLKKYESRLDSTLYRAKFCYSLRNARQLISHRKVMVNKQTVTSKSYSLKLGDLITINPKFAYLIKKNIKKANAWPIPPKHLTINYKTMQILFGEIENSCLSINFPFHLNLEKLIINYRYL